MEKIRSLVGMVSKKKFFSAGKCYENNKYGVDYIKPQLCIDEENHLIFCDRCGAVIDPFAAMLMVAIFEERQNREWGRYMESARRFWKIAHSYKPYRVAIKEMDMPENCLKCPFIDESGQYCQVDGKALVPNILCIDIEGVRENFKVLESGRNTDCPLIEIKDGEEK